MGWWGEEKDGIELIIGDGPLDTAEEMFKKIVQEYKNDVGRKPSPDELIEVLKSAIASTHKILFDGLDDMEVADLKIKIRKVPSKQKFQVGDYCLLALPAGGYGYVRIKDILGQIGLLVELLDVYSEAPLRCSGLENARVISDMLTDRLSIKEGDWRVLQVSKAPTQSTKRSAEKSAMEFDRQFDRLGGCYGSGIVPKELEKHLRELGRLLE